ncbi:dehydrogenase/reductase SDR family member 7 [Pantherophis guttatus]|uniref:Dehydrogenase/reductase SDR family member 7 n=1 Tax=Pantherophis guttatus TaxID=94885 RepID=A0A6P9D1F5_PANGU|nr:dehydrogenase/reductase SDR family member 7 [Pantherophis guttatus]
MEICIQCCVVGSIITYLILQILRWIRADSDLTVQWAEWWGKSPEKELPRKVVWVTGASSGIGEELAYQLAKIGSWLVLSARRENELERVKKKCLEISSLSDKDILILPLDLTDRGFHESATKTVLQHFGRIDVLVNNGGRSQRSLFVDTSISVYNAIMELNYLGTVSLTKFVLDHMIQRKQGKIVTMSSVMGVMGAPLATGYCASKHALQGFFNSLRPELVDYPEISIINICPGPVQSQIIQNVFTEEISKVNENVGDQSHKMTTERCARLTLVSMANDVKEAWISDHPYLAVCYLWQYAPTWAWWLLNRMGKKRIENFKSGVDADVSYYKKSS